MILAAFLIYFVKLIPFLLIALIKQFNIFSYGHTQNDQNVILPQYFFSEKKKIPKMYLTSTPHESCCYVTHLGLSKVC